MATRDSSHSLDRRDFLKTVGLSAAALALGPKLTGAADAAATPQRPPNILFVLADQWRFSAFSHGSDPALVKTPNFDRLADQGARFTRMYATNPVCTPNRSCIMTSRFSHQQGMIHNDIMLPPSERCMPEVFASAGYATHYIGKWHMDGMEHPGYVPKGWRRRGIQTFEGFNRGHFYPKGAQYFTDDGKLLKPDVFESFYQTDLAVDFMKRQKDNPFFCYLSWGPPHTPYRPPTEFDRFSKMPKLAYRPNVPEKLRDAPVLHKELAGYYGLCETLDHEIGRLLKSVDDMGLTDNTIVLFTADHGDMQGSHGLYRKGKPQEESCHIPLLMRWPGKIKNAQTPSTLGSSIDLMPTLLSMCGLKAPPTCVGKDLSGAVLGGPAPKVDSVYSEGSMRKAKAAAGQGKKAANNVENADDDSAPGGEWRALVTPTHKLIKNVAGGTLIYDLEKDPYEMNNLADDKSSAPLRADLEKQMQQWAKDTNDPYPKTSTAAKVMYTDTEAKAAHG